jgi:L-fuconolactonase
VTIDAHHHFWKYNPVDYDWIDESMDALRRDFLPEDLASTIQAAGVDGVVSVQARQNLAETDWLLELAKAHPFIQGVVAWFPLADARIDEILEPYIGNRALLGARHVVQGEADGFLDAAAFNRGIEQLTRRELTYDILIFEHQLEEAIRFVDRHPNQRFVLDHIAKPCIRDGSIDTWRNHLTELAKREHVTCKLSGLVTEADYSDWTEAELRPYLETVLEAFGPDRLMFGSDWPVCLLATGYADWLALIRRFIAPLSAHEQSEILAGSARRAYGLPDPKK